MGAMGIHDIEQQAIVQPTPSVHLGYLLLSYARGWYLATRNKDSLGLNKKANK